MPKMKFDKRSIDKLPLTDKGQVDYFDTETPGLCLRVGMTAKTFFAKTDIRDAKKKTGYRTAKKTLGRYGDITLEEAKRMMEGRTEMKDGQKVFVPGARMEMKSGPITDNGATVTLDDMLDFYFTEKKRKKDGLPHKAATVKGYTRIIQRHFETWLPLTLPEVVKLTPEMVIERHKQIAGEHGAYGARNAFVMLTAIINYAIIRHPGVITTNPLNVLRLGSHMKKIEARKDKLEGNDFKAFYDGIQKFNEITRDAYLVCLYQGLRSEEAAGLKWEYVENGKRLGGIDLEKKEMIIPDTKNRQPLCAPLCLQSLTILKRRQEQNPEGTQFVFPSLLRPQCLNKTGHVRLMAAELKAKTGLQITVHGLRRTFITTARRLKIFEDAERLTNHVDSTVTGKHYDGTNVDDLRKPLQIIANEIERLMVEGVGAKVIQLTAAQGE
ncbi:tyrosine-type recombinase/integrase [Geobacter sp. AOG1]|uniref:tyrosine-type recombinase/integrase n=1 Tax=Geobacter sp. AOG1 TaxID=1566346 RepID=UPI001CC59596|nr:tyrosine-type recombinase/integrase [Geobacter sp. AOG1]GFE56397.1 integrase [Geobacter sp. AOG1]